MAEIKRTKKTTIKTTQSDQSKYVGQSKTAIKPTVLPVTPPIKTDISPSTASQTTPPVKPAPIVPSQPQNLPAADAKSGIDTKATDAPSTSNAPSSISAPSDAPSTPSPTSAPSIPSSPHESPLSPLDTPAENPETAETQQTNQTPQQKADYDKKIEEEIKNKPKVDSGAKDKAKDALENNAKKTGTKEAESVAAKRFSKAAMKEKSAAVAKAIGAALKAATSYLVGLVGWPWLLGCGAIILVLIMIFAGLACEAANCQFGKCFPSAAGPNDKHVLALVAATKVVTSPRASIGGISGGGGGAEYHKLDFLNKSDLDYIQTGKIDKRLAAALDYLVQKHEHIRVSHIISGYESIKTDPESGAFHDIQITQNISAHKDGLAADIDEIDYTNDKCSCGKKIPVKVSWQSINENPLGQTPDALNQIKSPDDFSKDSVKTALTKMGVKGLDQANLIEKMKAVPALAGITGPYDLLNSDIVNAFKSIGVTGMDNSDLQSGLKRVQALQAIYDLPTKDTNAMLDPNVQDLMNKAGIPLNAEVIKNIEKFKAVQTLQSITSLDDLQNPDIQAALKTAGIDSSNPDFQKMLAKIGLASTIANSSGSETSQTVKDALGQFSIPDNSDAAKAKLVYQTAKGLFDLSNNGMISDIAIINGLEQLSIDVGNPADQEAVGKMKASYTIFQPNAKITDPEVQLSLQKLGVPLDENAQAVITKYQAAKQALDYQGDLTDPIFLSYAEQIGITLNDDNRQSIAKYKAAQVLADVANKKIAYDSPAAKEALKIIGAKDMTDNLAKSAVNVGNAKNSQDPKIANDKKILGIDKEGAQKALSQFQSAKNLVSIYKAENFDDPDIQSSLTNLGLKDPKYTEYISQLGAANKLLGVKKLSDLQDSGFQITLQKIGINDTKTFTTLGQVGSLQTILQVKSIKDAGNPEVTEALQNLGFKNQAVIDNLGKIGGVYSLLDIHSAWDLTKPDVVQTMTDLGITNATQQSQLGQAGSLYTLTQIKNPADLANPQSLEALNNLGVIDLNSQLLGQIGAVQSLMNVRNIGDLMNPNSILALNTLGIISLSNPVSAAIMAIGFIDSLTGGKLLGAVLGQCKGNTKCYQPTAQTNVHKVWGELLQFPYDSGNTGYYKLTQMITFSQDRDVTPFSTQLDTLYGAGRPTNSGLFAMPEAWDHLHISY